MALVTLGNSEFDRDTAVSRRAPGVYDAHLSAGWTIIQAVNGGYLLALMGRALGDALPHPDPMSVTAHYLTASVPGPAVIRTEVVRTGRTMSTGTARLLQTDADGNEVERLRVLASYGDLDALPDDVRTTAKPPAIPPYEHCLGASATPERRGGTPSPPARAASSPAAPPSPSGSTSAWTRRPPAGRSAPPPARARCAPGSVWPTAATPTRSPCC